jgi:hypothetical protein
MFECLDRSADSLRNRFVLPSNNRLLPPNVNSLVTGEILAAAAAIMYGLQAPKLVRWFEG